jgi:hypothetical protein
MASPVPKRASMRQRRNRSTTAATLEAMPARRQPLPDVRWSSIKCQVEVKPDVRCPLPSWHHTKRKFQELEDLAEAGEIEPVEPHDYDPSPLAWRPTTVLWWDTIWASPMADEWVDADVPGLFALAILIDEFWVSGDSKIHAEVRQASREFGLSPFSRRQLQWEIKRLEAGKPAAPTRRPAAPRRAGGILGVLDGGKSAPATRKKAAG